MYNSASQSLLNRIERDFLVLSEYTVCSSEVFPLLPVYIIVIKNFKYMVVQTVKKL